MIKDGNYYFLDYEAHREDFIQILIDYYGKDKEKTIRERMDKVVYVPYMKYDNVIDYYSQSMTEHSEEIYKAFARIRGVRPTKKMKELIWRDGGSRCFAANFEGENLDDCEFFLGKEYCDEIRKARAEVCEAFGITAENPVPEIQTLCRQVKAALRTVADRHPCQVYRDVEKFINNKNGLLQKYLTYVSKYFLSMTERDIEIINNPDFDSYDVDNLDCRYMFFEDTIGNPGLVSYFTSASQDQVMNGTMDDQIRVLTGRAKWFTLNGGPECLKYVKREELFGGEVPVDKEDFIIRLIDELEYQVTIQPEATMTMNVADAIETNRRFLAETQYFGCRFAQNLNKSWDGDVHTASSEDQWMTTMGFYGGSIDTPINTIFFNEDTKQTPEQLLSNLIHENNHAVSFGNAFVSKDKKRAYGRYGLAGRLLAIDADRQYIGNYEVPDYDGFLSIEENINERQSKDMTAMFMRKFGSPFTPCDIQPKGYNNDFHCLYDYWSFLTQKFYETYGDRIRDTRVTEGKSFFFDNEGMPPASKVESAIDFVKAQYQKIAKPEKYDQQGFLSYNKVARLGRIIEQFQENVLPLLDEAGVTIEELNARSGEHYDKLASNTKLLIESLETSANRIVEQMQQDNIDNRRRSITRTFRKADAKETIEKVVGKGKSLVKSGVSAIEEFIGNKRKKNSTTPKKPCPKCKKPTNPTLEDDKTMGDDE